MLLAYTDRFDNADTVYDNGQGGTRALQQTGQHVEKKKNSRQQRKKKKREKREMDR
jgi:hypothetical protein